MAHRPLRLLLCWGYHRAGWIQSFESLRAEFEVHYLFHRSADEEEQRRFTDAPRHYWLDFADAQSVLDVVRPDRLVFMALDGAWAIALNAVARRRGVPTIVVQHGHTNPVQVLDHREPSQSVSSAIRSSSPLPATAFAARSFGWAGALSLIRTLRFMVLARRYGARYAMLRQRFDDRLPEYYVAPSPESAQIFLQLDVVSPQKIACIGLPEHDDLFTRVPLDTNCDGTVLLLDSPNAENRWNGATTTIAEKVAFLIALDKAVGHLGKSLRVKLHPETYAAHWLPRLSNGTYLRDADLVTELSQAAICIGFDSTLMIPAVWLRPTILVRIGPSRIVDIAADTGAALVTRCLTGIDASLLKTAYERFSDTEREREEYVNRLAFKPDGRAGERLREILSQPERGVRRNALGAG